jgi:hypothetical protein
MKERSRERVRTVRELRPVSIDEPDPLPATRPLPPILIRLLATALAVSNNQSGVSPACAVRIPAGYRQWPSMTAELPSCGRQESMTCYVYPMSAGIRHDQTFPTGTMFVIETYSTRPHSRLWGHPGISTKRQPTTLFVMEKHGEVYARGHEAPQREAWAYALYRPDGSLVSSGTMRSDVCGNGVLHPTKGYAGGFLLA